MYKLPRLEYTAELKELAVKRVHSWLRGSCGGERLGLAPEQQSMSFLRLVIPLTDE
jgi:hypothetical protein